MLIQIYAFTDPPTAAAAVNLGVDNVGFIAGKYGLVHGELTFAESRAIVTGLPKKAISVEDETSIAVAQRYAITSDLLLLDTKVKGFPGVGATGATHDWKISR